MSKLTGWMRDVIVDNAIEKAGINKDALEYKAERLDWACAVADESVGGKGAVEKLDAANKKISAIVKSLPENLRSDLRAGPMESSIYVSLGGMRTRINEWPDLRPGVSGLMLPSDHPLTIQFEKLEAKEKEIISRRSNLRAEVRAVLDSVTTINKLLSVWPEAKELLPSSAKPQVKNLPSVNVESLNAAIGLPTDETVTEPCSS